MYVNKKKFLKNCAFVIDIRPKASTNADKNNEHNLLREVNRCWFRFRFMASDIFFFS